MKIKNKRTDASDPPRHEQTCPISIQLCYYNYSDKSRKFLNF